MKSKLFFSPSFFIETPKFISLTSVEHVGVDFVDFAQGQQDDHRVGGAPAVVRPETGPERQGAFFLEDFACAVHEAGVRELARG